MPASTRIIIAREIKSKLKDFEKIVSLVDTGTDAYLRQDDGLMCPTFPSSTVINTAGPDQLRASKSGLLNLLVKDEKGNMHQIMLENALVFSGLSPSHKQLIENGHTVSLKEDKPVCNSRTSSNKFVSTITVLSYIPIIVTFIIYNLDYIYIIIFDTSNNI